MRRTRLFFVLGSLACAAALPLLVVQPACSPAACTQSALDPNTPSPAIECAAGLLCYQGQCIRACSAGQERAQECGGDGDCDGSRPNCIDGYCSACENAEYCVPTLNICQSITEIELPPPPDKPQPGASKPPAPLDAGWIDGGIQLTKDAGNEVPVDRVVTHAGLVDVAQIVDYYDNAGGVSRPKINVTMLRVSDVQEPGLIWRVDPWNDVGAGFPPATEETIEEVLGEECSLSYLQAYTASVSLPAADMGMVTIDSAPEFPDSAAARIEIPWDGTKYVVPANLPSNLLRFSVLSPSEPHFLTITGGGSDVTGGSWPNPDPDNGEHVPFALVPSPETLALLDGGARVEIAAPGDLVVRWDRIASGVVAGEAVVLRFRGNNHEINCQKTEGNTVDGSIIVKAGLLRSFIMRESIAAGTTIPLYFERRFARRTDVLPADQEVIDVAIRIRHTFIGSIRFE